MADPDIDDIERRMNGAVEALKREFGGLRAGRASTASPPSHRRRSSASACAVGYRLAGSFSSAFRTTVSRSPRSARARLAGATAEGGGGTSSAMTRSAEAAVVPERS